MKMFDMMKSAVVAGLLVVSMSAVSAEDVSLDFWVGSNNVERGESVTDDSVSAGAELTLDGLFDTGLYVRGAVDSYSLTPVTGNLSFRSDVGVGYKQDFDYLTADLSFNHVLNPVYRAEDYNELRLRVESSLELFGHVDAYLDWGYTLEDENLLYSGIGLVAKNVGYEGLDFGVGTSFYSYKGDRVTSYTRNAISLDASYNVWRNFDVFATYSRGNKGSYGQEIGNESLFGVRGSF